MEGDAVEGPVVCIGREEVLQALDEMKTGKGSGHAGISLELTVARWEVVNQMMTGICQKVLDRIAMSDLWL